MLRRGVACSFESRIRALLLPAREDRNGLAPRSELDWVLSRPEDGLAGPSGIRRLGIDHLHCQFSGALAGIGTAV